MAHIARRSARFHVSRLVGAAAASLLVTTSLVLGAAPQAALADYSSACASPTRTVSATDLSIKVGPGETVLVAANFTGGVDALPAGATLCVGPGATLTGSYLNNPSGALVVAQGATLVLPSVAVNTGFALDVEGEATIAGLNMNGSAAVHVAPDASLTFSGSVSAAAGVFTNEGVLRVEGAFNVNNGVVVDNRSILSVLGSATVSGPMSNSGLANFSLGLTINGSGSLQNSCAVNALGDLINNGRGSANSGVVLSSGTFTNNGDWTQSQTGVSAAAGFVNDGAVTGFGRYSFSGQSGVQGSFIGDSASDPIVVQSTATPPKIFDLETGSIANTVRGTVNVLFPPPNCGTTPITASADVEVAKSGPAQVLENGSVGYSITVTNWGQDAAEDVVVSDALPAGFALDPTSTTGSEANGVLTWSLGELAAGASVTLTFSGTATAPAGDILHNVVSSTSSTLDLAPSNNDGTESSSQVDTEVIAVPPPGNEPPIADPLVKDTVTGKLLVSRVNATDTDAGQTLSFTTDTRPAHGRLYFSASGGLVYITDGDFSGVDSFDYRVCDNGSPVLCDTATVTINVYPRAVDDAASTFVDTPVTIGLLGNDSDGAPLDAALVSAPGNGSVTLDPATGSAVYTPNPGFTGTDTFEYRICSPGTPALCDTALVTVTVTPANDPPVVDPLTQVTTVAAPVTDTLTTSDPNSGDTVSVYPGIPPRSGTITVAPDGTTVYTPLAGYAGHDFYSVIACDDGSPMLCSTGRVNVDVFPTAEADAAATEAGTPVDLDVTLNDAGSVEPPSLASPPASGTVSFAGGVAHYVPAPGFSGTDTFTYTICAIAAPELCATATVTITVAPGEVVPPAVDPDPDDGDNTGGSGTGGSSGGSLASAGAHVASPLGFGAVAVLAGLALLVLHRRGARPRRR